MEKDDKIVIKVVENFIVGLLMKVDRMHYYFYFVYYG